MERRDKVNYYLDLAEAVSQRGTCLRKLYGAVIVKNDEVISTGYVGAPRGRKNCSDLNVCIRQKLQIPRGERYEVCRSVHAEANAIISAPRDKMLGSQLYLLGRERPSAREALALQYVTEALAQEEGLAVTDAVLTQDGSGRAALRAELEWRGMPLAVQVELTV